MKVKSLIYWVLTTPPRNSQIISLNYIGNLPMNLWYKYSHGIPESTFGSVVTPPSFYDDWWLSAQVTRRSWPQLVASRVQTRSRPRADQGSSGTASHRSNSCAPHSAFLNLRSVIRCGLPTESFQRTPLFSRYGFTTSHHTNLRHRVKKRILAHVKKLKIGRLHHECPLKYFCIIRGD